MDRYNPSGMSRDEWIMSNPTVIDYGHQSYKHLESIAPLTSYDSPIQEEFLHNSGPQETCYPLLPMSSTTQAPRPEGFYSCERNEGQFGDMVALQLQMLNANSNDTVNSTSQQPSSFGTSTKSSKFPQKYNPFLVDDLEDMDISDDENAPQNVTIPVETTLSKSMEGSDKICLGQEIKSGSAFYKGLILFIPPFEQLSSMGSPVLKMLYSSFEFSFKKASRIETKKRENDDNGLDAIIKFGDNIISIGSGWTPHVEASVRALELLSETCYTIQAKADYFRKCKMVNGDKMKTVNIMRWERISEKYPKLLEITKTSHIQKSVALFLDCNKSSENYEDIMLYNLTREDVNNIKSVVEFFKLTMLPCCGCKNMSKKQSPCVVSIHNYSSAQELLDHLIKCGGEDDQFKVYPPDTFKDFYKLHLNYRNPYNEKLENKNVNSRTTLDDEELQSTILRPYKNLLSELFKKHKSIKMEEMNELLKRKLGDHFMMNTLQIDIEKSKSVAPKERMQLLLNFMEQLQKYGNRLLDSGELEMIKMYHNAVDNLRKDLDTCRQDIENQQKNNISKSTKSPENPRKNSVQSHPPRKTSSPQSQSRFPTERIRSGSSQKRPISPRNKMQPRFPKQIDKPHRSLSPRLRQRSKSPTRRPSQASAKQSRSSLRRAYSPPTQSISPRYERRLGSSTTQGGSVSVFTFKDRFKYYIETLQKFHNEIELTPVKRRSDLKERLRVLKEQYSRFYNESAENPAELVSYLDDLTFCKNELAEQTNAIEGKPSSLFWIPQNSIPPEPTKNFKNPRSQQSPHSVFEPILGFGARIPPPLVYHSRKPTNFKFRY